MASLPKRRLANRVHAAFRNALLALCLVLPCAPARAWNQAGHMVSAAIAYAVLAKQSPGAIPKIVALLEQHPQYASMWKPQLAQVSGQSATSMYLFMLAARWPDDVRDDPKYDHGDWHYIDIPYKPKGQPASIVPPPPAVPNVATALNSELADFEFEPSASRKAIGLCWIFHLIGDIHQPLHTASLFTLSYPNGDAGGTRFFIRPTPASRPLSLHAFWDDLILDSDRFYAARSRAAELLADPAFAPDTYPQLAHTKPKQWAYDESFPLAKRYAYRYGKLKGTPDPLDLRAPVLPRAYVRQAHRVADRQIVLAGYRLADKLEGLFR